jgi:hypothetical protein
MLSASLQRKKKAGPGVAGPPTGPHLVEPPSTSTVLGRLQSQYASITPESLEEQLYNLRKELSEERQKLRAKLDAEWNGRWDEVQLNGGLTWEELDEKQKEWDNAYTDAVQLAVDDLESQYRKRKEAIEERAKKARKKYTKQKTLHLPGDSSSSDSSSSDEKTNMRRKLKLNSDSDRGASDTEESRSTTSEVVEIVEVNEERADHLLKKRMKQSVGSATKTEADEMKMAEFSRLFGEQVYPDHKFVSADCQKVFGGKFAEAVFKAIRVDPDLVKWTETKGYLWKAIEALRQRKCSDSSRMKKEFIGKSEDGLNYNTMQVKLTERVVFLAFIYRQKT